MAIGFPLAPTIGTPHSYQGKSWTHTGNGWKKVVTNSSAPYEQFKTVTWGYKIPTILSDYATIKEIGYT